MGLILSADASFDLEALIQQSTVDEEAFSHFDLGPTDALDVDIRELECDAFRLQYESVFGTSPLTSTSSSRSASPDLRSTPTDVAPPLAPAVPRASAPTSSITISPAAPACSERILSGNSKTRRNKAKAKTHRREVTRPKRAASPETRYVPSKETYAKYVKPAEAIKADFDTANLSTASTGYVAMPDSGGKVYELKYLIEDLGFTLVKASPGYAGYAPCSS